MPRYVFPAGSVGNTTGAPLRLTFHATNTTGRREVDLWTVDGSNNLIERIPNGVVLTDSSGAYSAFAGPDDIDTLYRVPHTTTTRTAISATATVSGGGGTYVTGASARQSITYNGDGTVNTVTDTDTGAVTTYTYNVDGTPATESRVLNGVTTTRTFSYSGGNLTAVS